MQEKPKHYQIIARRYRPQKFSQVIGQEAIVATLKSAIFRNRLGVSYLFSGPRGTGKTTLARIFAKALNCLSLEDGEPCGKCSSCQEIVTGASLDVLEIDGASHRGIEDIRQINETVAYSSSGKYKVYIIDEVHMLTKEAFNALLKTLEEPPSHVKFFFATTEPHKILPTITSRCQKFQLKRIPLEKIVQKLSSVAKELEVDIDEKALKEIAYRAEGGLRDAESLLDQIISFHEGPITLKVIEELLGLVSKEKFFLLDQAAKEGNFEYAFTLAKQVYSEGKNISFFIESLMDHFRTLLKLKLSSKTDLFSHEQEQEQYEVSSSYYVKEQLISLLDMLFSFQIEAKTFPHEEMAITVLLLKIIRSFQPLSLDQLINRLVELEKKIVQTAFLDEKPVEKDLPIKKEIPLPLKKEPSRKKMEIPSSFQQEEFVKEQAPVDLGARPSSETIHQDKQKQGWKDTVLEFAAIELGGVVKKL